MAKYVKKPIVIEAVQFLPDVSGSPPADMFIEWPILVDERGPHLIIHTLEGDHRADPGDWIITGIKGEKYPIKDEVFRMTYERVPDA